MKTKETVTPQNLEGGFKADSGKPQVGLIPAKFLRGLAELFTMGATKYSPHNWMLGMKYSRVYDAAQRHLLAFWDGESNDAIDGQHHLLSVAWCCCVMYIFDTKPEKYKQFDDRHHNLTDEEIRASINKTAKK